MARSAAVSAAGLLGLQPGAFLGVGDHPRLVGVHRPGRQPPAASTRSRSSLTRACARAGSTNAVRCSPGVIDPTGAVVRPSRTWFTRTANQAIRWPCRSRPVVVDL